MVLGPTKNAGVRRDAEGEDVERSEEALQGDGVGQADPPSRDAEPQPDEEVVEACMLVSDFMTLPHGDNTNIGSNGIALSGGQKQRVSLARALYVKSDLVLSDDILSGLDNDTANEVNVGRDRRQRVIALLQDQSPLHRPSH